MLATPIPDFRRDWLREGVFAEEQQVGFGIFPDELREADEDLFLGGKFHLHTGYV